MLIRSMILSLILTCCLIFLASATERYPGLHLNVGQLEKNLSPRHLTSEAIKTHSSNGLVDCPGLDPNY